MGRTGGKNYPMLLTHSQLIVANQNDIQPQSFACPLAPCPTDIKAAVTVEKKLKCNKVIIVCGEQEKKVTSWTNCGVISSDGL